MKKLNLDMAELQVESFETFVSDEAARGTVRANLGCVTYSCKGTCGNIPASDVEKNGFQAVTYAACCV